MKKIIAVSLLLIILGASFIFVSIDGLFFDGKITNSQIDNLSLACFSLVGAIMCAFGTIIILRKAI